MDPPPAPSVGRALVRREIATCPTSRGASARSWTCCIVAVMRRRRRSRGPQHDAPSYSAVRAVLRLLEERGHVKHAGRTSLHLHARAEARRVRGGPRTSSRPSSRARRRRRSPLSYPGSRRGNQANQGPAPAYDGLTAQKESGTLFPPAQVESMTLRPSVSTRISSRRCSRTRTGDSIRK